VNGLTSERHFSHDQAGMVTHNIEEYKANLASLTTRELIKLADQSGIELSPGVDRLFIIRELLENTFEEPLEEEPPADEKPDIKTVTLPKQYQITYMEALPRDPQWVYVCWELRAQDREHYEADYNFEGYALRAMEEKNGVFVESFTVPVGLEDNSWYLGFTGGGSFRIGLWIMGLNICPVMSRTFTLPRFINSPGNEEILERPLNRLSGAADFSVLKDQRRLSRLHT
jgi:hypothetical protein